VHLQSTFISYGGPDEAFARRLHEALRAHGVNTFFFAEHAVPGEKLHRLMRNCVNEHDRVILVCSKASLDRNGVLNEIEETLQREARDGGASYLIPVRLDGYIFSGWNPPHKDVAQALKDRVVADFEGADRDPAKFHHGISRLLAALRGEALAREHRGEPVVIRARHPRSRVWIMALVGIAALAAAVYVGIATAFRSDTKAPVATPSSAKPDKVDLGQFVGNWEVSVLNLKDARGKMEFYQPIRIIVQNTGEIRGTAGINGKVINVTGKLTLPRSVTQSGFTYAAADVKLSFSDGCTGSGKLAFTMGLPVVEMINFSKGTFSGQMYAHKI
jgi:hypothetical protein